MYDHRPPLERFIQLEALWLVVDSITGEVFDKAVEGDWSQSPYHLKPIEPDALDRDEGRFAAVRVDLVAAHMFAELSAASEWLAEKARDYADRAHQQIVEEVGG